MAEALGRGRPVVSSCQLVEAIQQLGHLPTQSKNSSQAEKTLAVRLIRARKADLRKAWEVRKLQQRAVVRIVKAEEMMQEVRGFGRYPMESRQDVRERQLADKLRKARKAKRFSPAQEAELQVLQQAARDARAEARRLKRIGPRSRWCSSACPKCGINEHGVGDMNSWVICCGDFNIGF